MMEQPKEGTKTITLHIAALECPMPFVIPYFKVTSAEELQAMIRKRGQRVRDVEVTIYDSLHREIDWDDWADVVKPGEAYLADFETNYVKFKDDLKEGSAGKSPAVTGAKSETSIADVQPAMPNRLPTRNDDQTASRSSIRSQGTVTSASLKPAPTPTEAQASPAASPAQAAQRPQSPIKSTSSAKGQAAPAPTPNIVNVKPANAAPRQSPQTKTDIIKVFVARHASSSSPLALDAPPNSTVADVVQHACNDARDVLGVTVQDRGPNDLSFKFVDRFKVGSPRFTEALENFGCHSPMLLVLDMANKAPPKPRPSQ